MYVIRIQKDIDENFGEVKLCGNILNFSHLHGILCIHLEYIVSDKKNERLIKSYIKLCYMG